jgi:sterol desaturase/sphingolipid hydroxylase (fatty acid hydroxylase superfamily)
MLLEVLLTLVLVFIVCSLFGYGVHWALHQSWAGRFNHAHMTHHQKLYPALDYRSDKYRNAGKDNTTVVFGAAALPLVAIPVVLWLVGIMPLLLMGIALGEMLLLGFLHEYIHTAFHIRGHWLNRLPAFTRWDKLHYIHHLRMDTNYGIFTFWLDRLLKTFVADFDQ